MFLSHKKLAFYHNQINVFGNYLETIFPKNKCKMTKFSENFFSESFSDYDGRYLQVFFFLGGMYIFFFRVAMATFWLRPCTIFNRY